MAVFRIGDYDYTIIDSGHRYVRAKTWDKTKVAYEALSSTVEYDGTIYTLTSLDSCFFNCTSFNQPIEIPDSVTNMEYCFCNCTSLNSPITFKDSYLVSMAYCFDGCTSFNQPIKIPNRVRSMLCCFRNCASFNQFIEIPRLVLNMAYCFYGCASFNQSILCFNNFNNPTGYSNIFTSIEKDITIIAIGEDNYPTWRTIADSYPKVSIPDDFEFEYGDYRYTGTTYGTTAYEIGVRAIDKTKVEYGEILKTYINNRKITTMDNCFRDCLSFNRPIEIPNSVIDMNDCFTNCVSFDQSIEIPNSVMYMNRCFSNCISFNSPLTFENNSSVRNMASCFLNCPSFNQLIEIPDSVTNMEGCFMHCTSFNQSIEIPSSVTNMRLCFGFCTSLETDIKVKNLLQKTGKLFMFNDTEKDIYIINEASPSLKEDVARVWREVADEDSNVHYEFDDHPSPLLELDVRRVNEKSKPSTSGIYVLVNLKYTFSNSYVPYSYPAPSLESESLVLDDIRTIPLTEKRSYLINDIDENQHVFVYTVSDGYKTSTITKILSRVMALLDFQGDSGKDYVDVPGMGMAIGTIATRNGLAIQFPTTIGDELLPATKKTEVYTLTTDTEFNPEKNYYEKDGDNYVLTEDTEFVDGKEYYENREAVDLNNYQLIIGQYNKEDATKAFIIGNGGVNEGVVRRSNVFTIDWNGNTVANGEIEDGNGIKISDTVKKSGDTMTGNLNFTTNNKIVGLGTGYNARETMDIGWHYDNRDGAFLYLRSKDFSTDPSGDLAKGEFAILARNESSSKSLKGRPNGTLTWDGNSVPTIVQESFTNNSNQWSYRKWSNGVVELWSIHYWASLTWTAYLSTGLYYSNFTSYQYPFDVLTNKSPVMVGNVRYVNANVGWLANLDIFDARHCKGTVVRNGNSGSVYVSLYVKGMWK